MSTVLADTSTDYVNGMDFSPVLLEAHSQKEAIADNDDSLKILSEVVEEETSMSTIIDLPSNFHVDDQDCAYATSEDLANAVDRSESFQQDCFQPMPSTNFYDNTNIQSLAESCGMSIDSFNTMVTNNFSNLESNSGLNQILTTIENGPLSEKISDIHEELEHEERFALNVKKAHTTHCFVTASTPEQSATVKKTIQFLNDRLPIKLRYRFNQLLEARIVSVLEQPSKHHPVVFRVEYPIGSGIIWSNPCSAGRQAKLDSIRIKCAVSQDKIVKTHIFKQDGPSSSYGEWDYFYSSTQTASLLRLLPLDVRSGKISVEDWISSQQFSAPKKIGTLPSQCEQTTSKTVPTIEHLESILDSDTFQQVADHQLTEDGSRISVAATIVKPSSASTIKRVPADPTTRNSRPKVAKTAPRTVAYKVPTGTKVSTDNAGRTRITLQSTSTPCSLDLTIEEDSSNDYSLEFNRLEDVPIYTHLFFKRPLTSAHILDRQCSICSTPIDVSSQNELLYSSKINLEKTTCTGYVCPTHPSLHSYCLKCLFNKLGEAKSYPCYCPGVFKRHVTLVSENFCLDYDVDERVLCDSAIPPYFLTYAHSRLIAQCMDNGQDATIWTASMDAIQQSAKDEYQLQVNNTRTEVSYTYRCQDCSEIVHFSRLDSGVPREYKCSCGTKCTGCSKEINGMDSHEECTRWYHSADTGCSTESALLKKIKTPTKKSNHHSTLVVSLCEFFFKSKQDSQCSFCPSCNRRHVLSNANDRLLVICSCRTQFCHGCEYVIPTSNEQRVEIEEQEDGLDCAYMALRLDKAIYINDDDASTLNGLPAQDCEMLDPLSHYDNSHLIEPEKQCKQSCHINLSSSNRSLDKYTSLKYRNTIHSVKKALLRTGNLRLLDAVLKATNCTKEQLFL